MIQDFMLAFFAHVLMNMGFAWLVWGLIACSLLTSPSISFCSHLVLTLVLPLGILDGSYAGFGNFDNNSGCFALLLVVVYWWLVHLEETRLATVSVPESDFFSAKNKKKVPHLFNGNSEKFL
jgi:hypothetical protein